MTGGDLICTPSVVARDLIGALANATGGTLRYEAIGTAGGAGGSVITTLRATTADGLQHVMEIAIDHAAP